MVDIPSGREPIRAESTGVGDMHYGEGKPERNTCYQRLRAGLGVGGWGRGGDGPGVGLVVILESQGAGVKARSS